MIRDPPVNLSSYKLELSWHYLSFLLEYNRQARIRDLTYSAWRIGFLVLVYLPAHEQGIDYKREGRQSKLG